MNLSLSPVHRIPSSIFWSTALVVVKPFGFCLSGKVISYKNAFVWKTFQNSSFPKHKLISFRTLLFFNESISLLSFIMNLENFKDISIWFKNLQNEIFLMEMVIFLFLVTDGRFVFPCLKFWQPVNIFCQCSYILMFIENKVYFKWNANYVLIDSINFHIFSVLANISANIVLSRSETNMVCFPGLSICLSSHGFCSIKVATGIWWIDTIIFTVICSSLHHRVSYFKLFNSGPNLTLFEIKILAPDFFLLCPCLVYFCSVFQLLPFSVHFIYNFCI